MVVIMNANASFRPANATQFEGDLQQLRAFYYAATYRNFTRAAEELHTGQPSISNHIKQLEKVLGVSLFERQRRGVELTAAGQALLELVAPLVQGLDRLPLELAERTAALTVSEVRVAAGQEILLHLLAPVMQVFRRRNPDVRLVVFATVRSETQSMVAKGEIDFGVSSRAGLPPGLEFQEILADELVLITPLNHDLADSEHVTLDDIARYPVLMPDSHSSTRHVIEEAFAQANLRLQIAMELERWQIIKEFVALGHGIALVPSFSLADDGRFVGRPVQPGLPKISYGIIYRAGAYLSPAARSLIDAIRKQRFEAATAAG